MRLHRPGMAGARFENSKYADDGGWWLLKINLSDYRGYTALNQCMRQLVAACFKSRYVIASFKSRTASASGRRAALSVRS